MYLSKSTTVRSDIEKVAQTIETLESYPQWNPLFAELKRSEAGQLAQGARFRGRLRLGTRESTLAGRVVSYRPQRQLRLELGNWFSRAVIEWRIETSRGRDGVPVPDNESKVTLTFGYECRLPLIGPLVDRFVIDRQPPPSLEASLQALGGFAHKAALVGKSSPAMA